MPSSWLILGNPINRLQCSELFRTAKFARQPEELSSRVQPDRQCCHRGLPDSVVPYPVSTSESCPALTVPIPPPGNEPEAFSSLAFFLTAAIAVQREIGVLKMTPSQALTSIPTNDQTRDVIVLGGSTDEFV